MKLLLAAALLLALACGCDMAPPAHKSKTTIEYHGPLVTVQHDDHLLIISQRGMLHHPGCPCLKPSEPAQ